MSYSGDLIRINGQTLPGIKEYKLTYAKLWKDAERNMNGDINAALIGIFPKITLVFRAALSGDQISTLCALLDTPYFTVQFYNPKSKSTSTAKYYAGDYTVAILDRSRDIYDKFEVPLVPVSKA